MRETRIFHLISVRKILQALQIEGYQKRIHRDKCIGRATTRGARARRDQALLGQSTDANTANLRPKISRNPFRVTGWLEAIAARTAMSVSLRLISWPSISAATLMTAA